MNIGFYGHSICAYRGKDSFIDIVEERTKSNIINIGVRQGSEERILFELKKTKKIDLAIIFHSPHNFVFLPGCERDFAVNSNFANKAQYIWDAAEVEEWTHHKNHHENFFKYFGSKEEFIKVMNVYRERFYNSDLTMNRYYGSLLQIDQYLLSKKIKTIHVISKRLPIPVWFQFKSGIVDYSITEIIEKNGIPPNTFFVNCITKKGNELVADRLLEIFNEHSLLDNDKECVEA